MTSSTEGIFPTALAFGSVRAGGVAAFGCSFLSQTAASFFQSSTGLPEFVRQPRPSFTSKKRSARAGVVKALEGLREVPNIVSEWAQELARKMGKPLFDPNSVDYRMREILRKSF